MYTRCQWQGKMRFSAQLGNHSVPLDTKSPLGDDSAPSPKELMLAGLVGCTAMDVIALLKKFRQEVTAMDVEADAPVTKDYPQIFQEVVLTFNISGSVDAGKAKEAVHLSQSRYCGVSAMVAKASPIRYVIKINGDVIGEGQAHFP